MTGFTNLTIRMEWRHIDLAKFQDFGQTEASMGV
jgi:hypothetical protein